MSLLTHIRADKRFTGAVLTGMVAGLLILAWMLFMPLLWLVILLSDQYRNRCFPQFPASMDGQPAHPLISDFNHAKCNNPSGIRCKGQLPMASHGNERRFLTRQ
jgi:hypothetical protein